MVIHRIEYKASNQTKVFMLFIYKLSSGFFVRQRARTCHSPRSFNLYLDECAHSNSCVWLMRQFGRWKHQFAVAFYFDFDLIWHSYSNILNSSIRAICDGQLLKRENQCNSNLTGQEQNVSANAHHRFKLNFFFSNKPHWWEPIPLPEVFNWICFLIVRSTINKGIKLILIWYRTQMGRINVKVVHCFFFFFWFDRRCLPVKCKDRAFPVHLNWRGK